MNVVLIDPPNHSLDGTGQTVNVHPLGIASLAAAIAPHHDVHQLVCDVRAFDQPGEVWDAIRRTLERVGPDVVGITALTASFPSARRLAAEVRACLGPDCTIVMGGVHPTFRPDEALAVEAVDFVVLGEGEETLTELLAVLESGGDVRGVQGLCGRDKTGASWRNAPRSKIADLDSLAHPRRDGLLWEEHIGPGFYQSIITVRGCPYACVYCSVPASSARRTRYRSALNVADEMAQLKAAHDVPFLFFHDSVFTLNRKRTIELMDLVIERDMVIPYTCQTRTDRVDPDLLAKMKAGGCEQIFFGIESGHPESLEKIRKKVPLDDIRAAVDEVKRLGIRCAGFFMVGFPWETETHIRTTAEFATDLGLDSVSLFSATPLPGTALWDMNEQDLPESIDFRSPQINLTRMPSAAYASLFNSVRADLERYNTEQMMNGLEHWPGG